jgi:hypothetical protein
MSVDLESQQELVGDAGQVPHGSGISSLPVNGSQQASQQLVAAGGPMGHLANSPMSDATQVVVEISQVVIDKTLLAVHATKDFAMDKAGLAKEKVGALTGALRASLERPPEHIQCRGCSGVLPVPQTLFDFWVCAESHTVDIKDHPSSCPDCNKAKPTDYIHSLRCLGCETITPVRSEFITVVSKLPARVLDASKRITAHARDTTEFLLARPETFQCENCSARLAGPSGNWVCQVCQTVNERKVEACRQCRHQLCHQRVICGVCGKSTGVPYRNLNNVVTSTTNSMTQTLKGWFYNVTAQPYCECPQCFNTCTLNRERLLHFQGPDGRYNPIHVVCEKCNRQFEVKTSEISGSIPLNNSGASERKAPLTIVHEPLEQTREADTIVHADTKSSAAAVSVPLHPQSPRKEEGLKLLKAQDVPEVLADVAPLDPAVIASQTLSAASVSSSSSPSSSSANAAIAAAAAADLSSPSSSSVAVVQAIAQESEVGEPSPGDVQMERTKMQRGKVCGKCGQEKPKTAFSKSQTKKNNGSCKQCTAASQ